MIYYANPSIEGARDAMLRGDIGCITTPAQGNVTFPDEWDVIADNGCFADRWTESAWWSWLLDQPRTVRFAVCPDVLDLDGKPTHAETVERWYEFAPRMRRHGFTPAFVCQIGCTADTIPPDAAVVFLGGTTEWKLGPVAWSIASAAHCRGAWVHMGRVNSQRRFNTARAMQCDSCDGTYLRFGPDTNLPKLLGWVESAKREPLLWESVPSSKEPTE